MGRGRAKAKQTKVARDLKYNSGNTDLSALQAELAGAPVGVGEPEEIDEYDPYAKYYDEDEDGEESDED